MAAETHGITVNTEPITVCEFRGRIEHIDALLHQVLHLLQTVATPENLALLDRVANNPAMRWKRRNGGPL